MTIGTNRCREGPTTDSVWRYGRNSHPSPARVKRVEELEAAAGVRYRGRKADPRVAAAVRPYGVNLT